MLSLNEVYIFVLKNMRTMNCIKATLGLTVILALGACNNKQEPKNPVEPMTSTEDPMKKAEESNDAKFDSRKSEKDAEFLVKAAEINLKEIKLGKLAQQRSSNKDVKDLGKMMETDHDKAFGELSELALKKMITIPHENTDKINEDYDKFNKMNAKDFDKKYCDEMVDGHQDAISLFDKASTDSADPDIKAWAAEMLPKLHQHLDHAMACQKVLKDKK
jgi:putative membrane protein